MEKVECPKLFDYDLRDVPKKIPLLTQIRLFFAQTRICYSLNERTKNYDWIKFKVLDGCTYILDVHVGAE